MAAKNLAEKDENGGTVDLLDRDNEGGQIAAADSITL